MSLFPEPHIENLGSQRFADALKLLDMDPESLGFVHVSELKSNQSKISATEWFALEKAERLGAVAVYFRRFADSRASIPQVYIFDFTQNDIDENSLGKIHKEIWNSGEVRIAYIFKPTEVIFLNSSIPPNIQDNKLKPEYVRKSIKLAAKAQEKLKEFSGRAYDDGSFWETNVAKQKLRFDKSAYKLLLQHLSLVKKHFIETSQMPTQIAQDLIIQCMLVKYIEERVNEDIYKSKELKSFFKRVGGADNLEGILNTGRVLELFDALNNRDKLNGNVFQWNQSDRKEITKARQRTLSTFLSAKYTFNGQGYLWRQYSFTYLPVELISRLYEEFLEGDSEGKVYTPAHLAKFLVDECMPLNIKPEKINLNFKILDPSCGSGVFLVSAYKRLVQWWRIKNNFKEIKEEDIDQIKQLLINNIYGVDIDKHAAKLTTFSLSLALCDMLTPAQIWTGLKFEKLRENNIIAKDFFIWQKENKDAKFDLILGNPPFIRGGFSDTEDEEAEESVNAAEQIDSYALNQLALKFLGESIKSVRDGGLQCLIIFSPSLLYNTSSLDFRKKFFTKFNVKQIIDFTPLYRNKVLWDNKEPATAAIFTKKSKPDEKNILHLVIRRTKPVKERLFFEINEYDFHYVSKAEAITHPAIWKINLLGGGRLHTLYDRFKDASTIQDYITENELLVGEGFIIGKDGKRTAPFVAGKQLLPTKSFDENGIDYKALENINPKTKFVKLSDERLFTAPNLLIKENIGNKQIPVALNKKDILFKHKIISIVSKTRDYNKLTVLAESIKTNMAFYRFWIYLTSGQLLVSKNTAILKEDIMRLPFNKGKCKLTSYEENLISDVLDYSQDFLRYGEGSLVMRKIQEVTELDFKALIKSYTQCLTEIINGIYQKNGKKFQLSQYVVGENYVEVKLVYSDKKSILQGKAGAQFDPDIESLIYHERTSNLSIKRIIRIYGHDEITIIKPNQHRYWLKSIGYRDGDKIFSELVKQGF